MVKNENVLLDPNSEALRGGVGRLMANTILNFHFDYVNPSLSKFQKYSVKLLFWDTLYIFSKPIICSKAIPGKIQFQIKCLWWSGRTLFPVWSSSLMWENMVLWLNKAIKYGTRGGAGPRLASLMFTRVNWFSIAGHVKLQALACHQSQKSLKSCPPVSK